MEKSQSLTALTINRAFVLFKLLDRVHVSKGNIKKEIYYYEHIILYDIDIDIEFNIIYQLLQIFNKTTRITKIKIPMKS